MSTTAHAGVFNHQSCTEDEQIDYFQMAIDAQYADMDEYSRSF